MGLNDPRQIWDGRYRDFRKGGFQHEDEPWLARWIDLLKTTRELPVLELGCGGGYDTRILVEHGFRAIAADFSRQGLLMARHAASRADFVELDLRMGLPFAEERFQVIIASLCLHYFPWDQTQKIVAAIRGRLKTGGILIARFNSISDPQFTATSGENLEQGCRIIDGVFKHYFDQHDLHMLFHEGWVVQSMEEKFIQRYNRDKLLWEIVAQVC